MSVILSVLFILRPFISSLSYPTLDMYYNYALIAAALIFIKPRIKEYKNLPGQQYLFIFLLAILLSVIFSLEPRKSLLALPAYLAYIFVFLAIYAASKEEKKHLLHSLLITGTIVSLYAIYWHYLGSLYLLEYMQKKSIRYIYALEILSRARAFMPFVVPNALAGFIIMILPISAGHLLFYNKRHTVNKDMLFKSSIGFSVIALLFSLLLTKSVGALFSMFLALIIVMWFFGRSEKKAIFVLFASFCLILAVVFLLRSYCAADFTTPVFSLKKRLMYWRQADAVILRHPITGTGIGNFPFLQSLYAHNLFLQFWAETGILGISAFLGFIVTCCKSLFIGSKDPLRTGYAVAFLSFLIHNLFDFSFFLPEVCIFWWIVAALLVRDPVPQ